MLANKLLLLSFFLLGFAFQAISQDIQVADSLREKGEAYIKKGNYSEAETYLGEALKIYKSNGDTASWLKTGQKFASTLVNRSKFDEAFSIYDQLVQSSHPANNDRFRGDVLNSMGWASNRMSEYDRALEYFKRALPLSKSAGYTLLTAVIYDNIGQSYARKGEYSKSLELRKKALDYFEKLNDPPYLARTLNNIANLYKHFLLYDKALEYYSRSLEIRKELNNVNLLANIYNNIGGLQKDMGNYDQALIAYQKSLEYRKEAGSPQRTASTLNNIGVLYGELGNTEKALKYYQESINYYRNSEDLAISYKNIGGSLWELGIRDEAVTYYKKALDLKREIGNPSAIGTSLIDLARVENQRKNYARALDYAKQAHSLADSLKDYSLLSSSNRWLGFIYERQEERTKALTRYKKSLAYSRFLSKDSQIGPLMAMASVYDSNQSDSALVYGKEAIDLIEQGRTKTGSNSAMKADYFKQYSDFYIDLASWNLKYRDDHAEAYSLVEQAKARTLADELVQASRRIDETLPDTIRIKRSKILSEIDRFYSELRTVQDSLKRDSLESEIRKKEFEYAAFQNELHQEYPGYKKLELEKPITLQRARSLNDPGTAILEYAVNDNRLLIFFISKNEFSVKQYSLKELSKKRGLELKGLVQDFKDAILAHAGREELELRSSALYELLLEPFEGQINNYENLTIVPDGALAYLPFEALRHESRYLIERFKVKYVPSVSSLTLLKESDSLQEKQLLAVAGSEVMNIDTEAGTRVNSYSALPSTLIEVDSIASHFSTVTKLKNEEVTESTLKQHLNRKYKYIHIATHGYIDEDQPNQSGLRLTGNNGIEASSEDDGLLKSSEIYRLNLSSDMVVLSACNTGMGKVVKGEGMLGLQRAFFYAGTSTVVVSLWNVYDRSTASLMNEFYKSILKQDKISRDSWWDKMARRIGWDDSIPFGEKATAMQTAKLQLINHPLYNHPVYWAPFIVVGR